jgi:hypothetical protein
MGNFSFKIIQKAVVKAFHMSFKLFLPFKLFGTFLRESSNRGWWVSGTLGFSEIGWRSVERNFIGEVV